MFASLHTIERSLLSDHEDLTPYHDLFPFLALATGNFEPRLHTGDSNCTSQTGNVIILPLHFLGVDLLLL